MRTRIIGTGSCLPEMVVTNDDLSKIMDTSDEWISKEDGYQRAPARKRRNNGGDVGNGARKSNEKCGSFSAGDRFDHCRHDNRRLCDAFYRV